jgi:tetratricopeptide (TPR) repeat protein
MVNVQLLSLFRSLADKVARGDASIEEAVAQIESPTVVIDLDLATVEACDREARESSFVSPRSAHALAVLNRHAAIEIGDKRQEARCLSTLAGICGSLGRNEEAIRATEEQATIARKLNDKTILASAQLNQGDVCINQGEFQQAVELYREALAVFRELQERLGQSQVLGRLGEALFAWTAPSIYRLLPACATNSPRSG